MNATTPQMRDRMAAASEAAIVRAQALLAGRRVRSKFRIKNASELLDELNNVLDAIDCDPGGDLATCKHQLQECILDIEGEPEPELSAFGSERAQFDAQTEGVYRG